MRQQITFYNQLYKLNLNNILSRLKRKSVSDVSNGSTDDSLQTRTLRYAIATQDANSHNPFYNVSLGMRAVFFSFGLLITTVTLLFPSAQLTFAQEPSNYSEITEVAKQLNCPTCAGQNLADCRTVTCQQWRGQIDDLLQEGYSDQEVLDFFVARYGTQVLQEPPRSGFTLWLWILPGLAILIGGGWLYYLMRGWSQAAESTVTVGSGPSASATMPVSDDYLSQVDRDLGLDES